MFEKLLMECHQQEIELKERYIKGSIKGLYGDNTIWLNKGIKTKNEKTCVLAEELGHHYTSFGDILDQDSLLNRKQELRARWWAYEKLIPLYKIVQAQKAGITNRYELADYLGVTEDFLQRAIDRYKDKYGIYTFVNGQKLLFDPLSVC